MNRIYLAMLALMVGLLGVARAQSAPTAPTSTPMSLSTFMAWASQVQLANETLNKNINSSRSQLLIFQAVRPSAAMLALEDNLAHGYVDCTGTILCIGAKNFHPQKVLMQTGEALEATFALALECRWIGFSWSLAWVCPELYLTKDSPAQSLWMWQTNQKDYLITGSGLDGTGDAVTVVEGQQFLAAMRENMMIGRVLQSARKSGGGQYGGTLEPSYQQNTYLSIKALLDRIASEADVSIIGTASPTFELALKNARATFGNLPAIKIITHKSHYPSFGPCFGGLFARGLHYYLFDKITPLGVMVIIRRAGANEIIQGSLLTGQGTQATVGIVGSRMVEQLITQLNLSKLIDQTYSPTELLWGIWTLPCR